MDDPEATKAAYEEALADRLQLAAKYWDKVELAREEAKWGRRAKRARAETVLDALAMSDHNEREAHRSNSRTVGCFCRKVKHRGTMEVIEH